MTDHLKLRHAQQEIDQYVSTSITPIDRQTLQRERFGFGSRAGERSRDGDRGGAQRRLDRSATRAGWSLMGAVGRASGIFSVFAVV